MRINQTVRWYLARANELEDVSAPPAVIWYLKRRRFVTLAARDVVVTELGARAVERYRLTTRGAHVARQLRRDGAFGREPGLREHTLMGRSYYRY